MIENVPQALCPQTWPFSLRWIPASAYLVGGSVRDALLGRQADYLDLDFVLPEAAVETARAIATHYGAGFVLLDAEHQIARAVFKQATVDFAQQVGPSLETDLQRRDFTVNAIAYNPHTGKLLDPLQGYPDLQRQQIRMVAPENFKEDPLRLLRAYRQAAQLGFTLASDTQLTIQKLAPLLSQVAAERVQGELNYLINTTRGTPLLALAWQDGLLANWLPHAAASVFPYMTAIDQAATILAKQFPALAADLTGSTQAARQAPRSGPNWLKVAKLSQLLSSNPEIATAELWHLKYSRSEIQAVKAVLQCLPKFLQQLVSASEQEFSQGFSLKEQYFLFKQIGKGFPALVVLAIASDLPMTTLTPLVKRFLDPNDPMTHPTPLVTGRDLMQALGIPAGPQIGQLLEAIQLARAEGKLSTAAEALQWAKEQL
ncbi:MAG: CCA tRNA nucleotidyltransferase [Cyanothece sp. SIO1E1]|nr:CCA tRNA nucleotidyltransferase [Cyanothece sp. SIO1E1]